MEDARSMYVHAHDAVVTVPLGFALPNLPLCQVCVTPLSMLQCYNIVTFATSFFCHLATPQSLGLKFRLWIQKTRIICGAMPHWGIPRPQQQQLDQIGLGRVRREKWEIWENPLLLKI